MGDVVITLLLEKYGLLPDVAAVKARSAGDGVRPGSAPGLVQTGTQLRMRHPRLCASVCRAS
jgi:hypothetical protein